MSPGVSFPVFSSGSFCYSTPCSLSLSSSFLPAPITSSIEAKCPLFPLGSTNWAHVWRPIECTVQASRLQKLQSLLALSALLKVLEASSVTSLKQNSPFILKFK